MFDLPPVRITDAMLSELYASELPVPPTQDNRLLERDAPGPRDLRARQPRCR